VSTGCTQWLGGRRLAALFSDENALEACMHDDALYKLTIFTFSFFTFIDFMLLLEHHG